MVARRHLQTGGTDKRLVVLMVDDDRADFDFVHDLLGDDVWDVRHCDSARKLNRHLGGDPAPDAVLLDFVLGPDSGIDLMPRLNEALAGRPVVLLTGYGNEDVAVSAMKAGAVDYLDKRRLTGQALAQTLRDAIERSRLARELEEKRVALLESERRRVMMETAIAACHHLASPLAAIVGTVDMLLQDTWEDGERNELLELCRSAARDAVRVLDRIRRLQTYATEPYAGGLSMVTLDDATDGGTRQAG